MLCPAPDSALSPVPAESANAGANLIAFSDRYVSHRDDQRIGRAMVGDLHERAFAFNAPATYSLYQESGGGSVRQPRRREISLVVLRTRSTMGPISDSGRRTT